MGAMVIYRSFFLQSRINFHKHNILILKAIDEFGFINEKKFIKSGRVKLSLFG